MGASVIGPDADAGRPAGVPSPVRAAFEAPRAAGLAGIAFAALFVSSLLLLRQRPAPGSSAQEVAAWYLGHDAGRVAIVGLYLAPFSGIAFLWFIAVIRNWIGDREDRFFSTVFVGSGLLFVAMLFCSSAAAGASLAAVKFQGEPPPTPDTVVLSRSLAYALMFVCAVRAAGVFMIVVSTIALRSSTMPRWLVFGGYAAAIVLLFSVTYVEAVVLLFPLWVTCVSVVILRSDRARTVAAQ